MKTLLGFLLAGLASLHSFTFHAEAQAPLTTGDVTVRLAQGMDSAFMRPGQVVSGSVVRTTNQSVPRNAPASVQLAGDVSAGLSVQLVAVGVNGQMVRTGSGAGSPTGLSRIIGMTQAGAPKVAASGPRVYLPQGTEIKFTLAEAPADPVQRSPQANPARTATAATPPAAPRPPRLSVTAWTPYPDQGGVVPDAALLGEVLLPNSSDVVGKTALQLACDDRSGTKQPVFRFVVPHSLKLDLSSLGTTPTTVRSKDKVVMQFDVSTGTDDRLFLANRMIYFAKKYPNYDLVQYDADPRELGAFASSQNAGKPASFRMGDIDSRDLTFKIPPVTDTVLAVAKACDAAPYSGSKQLSPKLAEALVTATQDVAAKSSTVDQKPESLKALDGIIITTAEWNAYQNVDAFYYTVQSENLKTNGHTAPPRRKRCADALIATFKAGVYDKHPVACAYVDKEVQ